MILFKPYYNPPCMHPSTGYSPSILLTAAGGIEQHRRWSEAALPLPHCDCTLSHQLCSQYRQASGSHLLYTSLTRFPSLSVIEQEDKFTFKLGLSQHDSEFRDARAKYTVQSFFNNGSHINISTLSTPTRCLYAAAIGNGISTIG